MQISIDDGYSVVSFDSSSLSSWSDFSQRASRTSTLDCGVVLQAYGAEHGDRTFSIQPESLSIEQSRILSEMVEYSASVTLCCREGVFVGTIYSFNAQTQKIVFWPVQKI